MIVHDKELHTLHTHIQIQHQTRIINCDLFFVMSPVNLITIHAADYFLSYLSSRVQITDLFRDIQKITHYAVFRNILYHSQVSQRGNCKFVQDQ